MAFRSQTFAESLPGLRENDNPAPVKEKSSISQGETAYSVILSLPDPLHRAGNVARLRGAGQGAHP